MNRSDGRVVYTDVEYQTGRIERTKRLLNVGIVLIFVHAFIWASWGFLTNETTLLVVNLSFSIAAILIFLIKGKLQYRALARIVLPLAYFYTLAGVIFFDGMIKNESPIEHMWFIVLAISAWLILMLEETNDDRIYANIYVAVCFATYLFFELYIIEFAPIAPQPLDDRPMVDSVTKIILFSFLLAITRVYMRDIRSAQRLLTLANETLEQLVENTLPKSIGSRLRAEGKTFADVYPTASVLFADLVGFTAMSASMTPIALVSLLDDLFTKFDLITEELGLEKIKTIGDSYMVAGGLPEPRDDHATAMVELALRMREEISQHPELGIRIGINSGEVVAGVIGRKRLVYDLWGDTVNIASRMESNGRENEIQISDSTYKLIRNDFDCESLGKIEFKGRGALDAYLVRGRKIST